MAHSYSVNTRDWLTATMDLKVSPFMQYWLVKPEPEEPFTKKDFERVIMETRLGDTSKS